MMSSTSDIRKLIAGSVLAAALVVPMGKAAAAAAAELVGTTVGTTAEAVKASLVAQGYEVRKVKRDDGKLEAHASKDNKQFEISVDRKTGMVRKIELGDN